MSDYLWAIAAVAGFLAGAGVVYVVLNQGSIRVPPEVFQVIGDAVRRIGAMGKYLTPEQIRSVSDWMYYHWPVISKYFSPDQFYDLMSVMLSLMTSQIPGKRDDTGMMIDAGHDTWSDFERFVAGL